MKLFSTIISYLLFVTGALMTFLPISWFPSFYDVRYSGWSMIAGALLIYLVPLLLKVSANSQNLEAKNKALILLQFLIALVIFCDALGALGLYELYRVGIPYSYLLHVFEPLIGVIILTKIITARFGLRLTGALILAIIIVLGWGIIWEIFENLSDLYLHTRLAGRAPTSAENTTVLNLIQDTVGAISGSIYILFKNHFERKIKA